MGKDKPSRGAEDPRCGAEGGFAAPAGSGSRGWLGAAPSPARPRGYKSGRAGRGGVRLGSARLGSAQLGSARHAERIAAGGAARRAHGAGQPPPQRARGGQGQDEENHVSAAGLSRLLLAPLARGDSPAVSSAVANRHVPLLPSSIKDWKTRLSYFLQNSSNSNKRKSKKAGKHRNYFR